MMTDNDDAVLRLQQVTKRYRRTMALEDVTLDVPRGSVTVLLGANGAGKSTLLRIAHGYARPTSGTVRVFGMDPTRRRTAVSERIGVVPDAPDAPGWMTSRDLVRFCAAHYPTWDHEATARRLDELQVPDRTRLRSMSRGQAAKLMLVVALGHDPELVLLDEPFGRLDPLARDEVLRGVLAELQDGQRTVLCSTHELDLAARMADRIAVLGGGRLIACGSMDDVLGEEDAADLPARLHDVMRSASIAADVDGSARAAASRASAMRWAAADAEALAGNTASVPPAGEGDGSGADGC